MQGYLAAVSSYEEQFYVSSMFPRDPIYWIGAVDTSANGMVHFRPIIVLHNNRQSIGIGTRQNWQVRQYTALLHGHAYSILT